jgi:hypothetical protein
MARELDAVLRFRCTTEMKKAVEEIAIRERRDVPNLLRIIMEDYLAAQAAGAFLRESAVPSNVPRPSQSGSRRAS